MYRIICSILACLYGISSLDAYQLSPGSGGLDSTWQRIDDQFTKNEVKEKNYETAWELLAYHRNRGELSGLARAHQYLADWHDYYGIYDRDSVFYHQKRALEIYKEQGDFNKEAEAYITLGSVHLNRSEFDAAEKYIFRALHIYETQEDTGGIGKVYRKIGQLYGLMQDLERGIEYSKKALPLLKKAADYYGYSLAYLEISYLSNDLNLHQESIDAANAGLSVLEKEQLSEPGIEARLYSSRGLAYQELKDYDRAKADYIKSRKIVADHFGEEETRSWEFDIGHVQFLEGEYEEALPNLLVAAAAMEEEEYADPWYIYKILLEVFEKTDDHKNALLYAKKYAENRDTFFNNKIESLEAEGLMKYESGKKDEAIAQKDELLKQKNQVQILSFSLVGLFALLLAGLFYTYRKSKSYGKQLAILNQDLRTRNQEKEILLKEIHHRVKNNLQMISSLLSLQSHNIEDQHIKGAFLDSQARVNSMSLIHQKLYLGHNLTNIKMKNYFQTLIESLIDSYASNIEDIDVNIVMNNIELDVEQAIPIGLITNELITNSLKYAFPPEQKGKINIQLKKDGGNLVLDVSDNGIGLQDKTPPKETESGFGSKLIKILTRQLEGSLEQDFSQGFHTRISIPITANNVSNTNKVP